MSKLRRYLFVAGACIVMAAQLFAQGGATGAITGTVQDVTGAVVAGASPDHQPGHEAVARTLKTDANGAFTAPLLPVATYTVKVTAPGFGEGNFKDIAVRITETTRFTAKLAPLKVLEKVEVQAIVQSVETTTATTGQAIEAQPSANCRSRPRTSSSF